MRFGRFWTKGKEGTLPLLCDPPPKWVSMLLKELIYSPFILQCMYPRFAQLTLLAIGESLLLGLMACSKRLYPAHSEQTHHELTQRRQQWITQLHQLDERDSLTLDLTEELLPPPLSRDSGQTRSTPTLRHWHGTLSRHHTQIGSLIQRTKEQDSLHRRSQHFAQPLRPSSLPPSTASSSGVLAPSWVS